MFRKTLVVGDGPAGGGRTLPYTPPFANEVMGHQVAIIGGRVYCEQCGSVGLIAKTGGTCRVGYLTEEALEGDVCVCSCPHPQPLMSTLQNISSFDDLAAGDFTGEMLVPGFLPLLSTSGHELARKEVDAQVQHPPEAEIRENFCPNMTNKQFATLVLELRDELVSVLGQRLKELGRWDNFAQARVLEWFGDPGLGRRGEHLQGCKDYLQDGLKAAERVLRRLTAESFIRWAPNRSHDIRCVPSRSSMSVAAAVCAPDVDTHTIAFGLTFCALQRTSRVYGTEIYRYVDSQISTLLHEVVHFSDVFGAVDHWYGMRSSLDQLRRTSDFEKARVNDDSIVGYILGAVDTQ